MKRRLCIALLLFLVTSCVRTPPPYVSNYVEPSSSKSAPPAADPAVEFTPPDSATYVDQFDRPDTEFGLGGDWDLRTDPSENDQNPVALPPAQDGYIKNGRFTYRGSGPVYAFRRFAGMVSGVGAIGQFGGGSRFIRTAMGMSISAGESPLSDTLLFAATRSSWSLKVRTAGGEYAPVAGANFSPILENARYYRFALQISADSVTVHVPQSEMTFKMPARVQGDWVSFQERPVRSLDGDTFEFDAVWVTEGASPTPAAAG